MLEIPRNEADFASALMRCRIASELAPGVSYAVDRVLGEGGMAVAALALRDAPDGQAPVVIKVLKPAFAKGGGDSDSASVMVRKEAVALGRLNERVPSTPFVVRLIDTGVLAGIHDGKPVQLPWLALEYVHGGAEGTTLEERVLRSIEKTGFAFDPDRAAHALECIAGGLEAVHEVGVIHRDLTPRNVLCCGFGQEEIFKIADFGVARPAGVAATFGGLLIGTPGYAPPEQAGLDRSRIGPWTDVFSLAAMLYFMLTGEDYFMVESPGQAIGIVYAEARRGLSDARHLVPELRERETARRAIDAVLARATAARADERPHAASALAALILPWLRADSKRSRTSARRLYSVIDDDEPTLVSSWLWTVRHRAGDDRVVHSVAWDGDGHCLAATGGGLAFWEGTSWNNAPARGISDAEQIRFVHRVRPGQWLVGGDRATFGSYSSSGAADVVHGPDPNVAFTHASGDFEDLAVMVAQTTAGKWILYAISSRRWLRPFPLDDVAAVSALARIHDERWLICGRLKQGGGFAWLYEPLAWRTWPLEVPSTRAFLGCAAHAERGLGVAVGTDGNVIWIENDKVRHERIAEAGDLSAAALDVSGRGWCAAAGRLYLRSLGADAAWTRVWTQAEWSVPIVSLFADVGIVVAVSADGGVLEGRAVAEVVKQIDASR